MKRYRLFFYLTGIILLSFLSLGSQETQQPENGQWPREVKTENFTYKMYQPQLDSWDGYKLKAHTAIGIESDMNPGEISYGMAGFHVDTLVDKAARTVQLENLVIDDFSFPPEPSKDQEYLDAIQVSAPLHLKTMSLDRLEANLAVITRQKNIKTHQLDNTPPKIIFSKVPSILVYIDGNPVFYPVKGTSLDRVVNTRVLLLRDQTGYYLHLFDGYMYAENIEGPWIAAQSLPKDIQDAEKEASSAGQVDLLSGVLDPVTNTMPSLRLPGVPKIFVSFAPAELIVTDGEPDFRPINDTNILYVANTTANVFKDLDDQKTYVLISGRWFSASNEAGPWKFVDGKSLPEDFFRIPDDSPKENVKSSIPGTAQAREAVIANNIPTTIKVDRKTPPPQIEIDGAPQLKPIAQTGFYYVFNCAVPIIKMPNGKCYALYNGMWFKSSRVTGPWIIADTVPAVIYSIPASSELHYVTYVRVYNVTPEYVYFGYTPGYYGTVLGSDGTVVFGTGYVYTAYVGRSVWYSPCITYGYGSALTWTPWFGWTYSFGYGWGERYYWYHPPAPSWGPYYVLRHDYGRDFKTWDVNTSGIIHHHFDHLPGNEGGTSGNHYYFGRSYNSTNGGLIFGRPHSWKNAYGGGGVYTATSQSGGAATKGGARYTTTGQSGNVLTGQGGNVATSGGGNTVTTGAGNAVTAGSGNNVTTSAGIQAVRQTNRSDVIYIKGRSQVQSTSQQNNIYATRGGHVYAYEEKEGVGNWRNMHTNVVPRREERNEEFERLNAERSARHIGNYRAESFRSFQHQGFHAEGRVSGAVTSQRK